MKNQYFPSLQQFISQKRKLLTNNKCKYNQMSVLIDCWNHQENAMLSSNHICLTLTGYFELFNPTFKYISGGTSKDYSGQKLG